ncbi:MAG TPA: IclR family transcriptional regulator [Thermomicrobiales bacterium]
MNTIEAPVRDQNTSTSEATAPGAVDQSTLLSVDKALSIVELLMRRAEPLSARAIAAEAGINRTTTHRLLNALIHRGWIEKPAGTASYRLGLKFVALAHVGALGRNFLEEVRPAMEHLSRLTRETVHLGVLDGFEVLHVDKIESLERVGIASKIGSRGTPHTTGLGKALLAAGPEDVVEAYLAYAGGEDAAVRIADPAAFRAEIARTRDRGYSIDDEEDSIGVRCLGVAVLGAGGAPLCAISLTGPSPRFTLERVTAYAPEVVATVGALSRQLGWEPTGEVVGSGSA